VRSRGVAAGWRGPVQCRRMRGSQARRPDEYCGGLCREDSGGRVFVRADGKNARREQRGEHRSVFAVLSLGGGSPQT
jgi:hypothetical protein